MLILNMYELTAKSYGNRCGHTKQAPKLYHRPEHHKPTHMILHRCIERFSEWYKRPEIGYLESFCEMKQTQRRSERREALASIGRVIMSHLDLSSMCPVQFTKNGNKQLSVKTIADRAGVSLRRAYRVMYDLKQAGYIDIKEQHRYEADGSIKSVVAIKRISAQLLYQLGITVQALSKAKQHAERFNKSVVKKIKKAKHKIVEAVAEKTKHEYPIDKYMRENPQTSDEAMANAKQFINKLRAKADQKNGPKNAVSYLQSNTAKQQYQPTVTVPDRVKREIGVSGSQITAEIAREKIKSYLSKNKNKLVATENDMKAARAEILRREQARKNS